MFYLFGFDKDLPDLLSYCQCNYFTDDQSTIARRAFYFNLFGVMNGFIWKYDYKSYLPIFEPFLHIQIVLCLFFSEVCLLWSCLCYFWRRKECRLRRGQICTRDVVVYIIEISI